MENNHPLRPDMTESLKRKLGNGFQVIHAGGNSQAAAFMRQLARHTVWGFPEDEVGLTDAEFSLGEQSPGLNQQ